MKALDFAGILAVLFASSCIVVDEAPCTCEGSAGTTATGATGATGGSGASGGLGGASGTLNQAGAPVEGEWLDATGNLAGLESECGNLTSVFAKPGEDLLIAGVARLGLWGSSDGGESWEPLGTDDDSDEILNRPMSLVFDPDDPDIFWEAGIYNGPGVYKTTDGGNTFSQLGDIQNIDLLSIDFTDSRRRTMLAGGHEARATLYRSTDGGKNWDNIGPNLPNRATSSSNPLVIDDEVHLLGCPQYGEGDAGIYRSTDGGESWSRVSERGGERAPLWASDGNIYWASSDGGPLVVSDDLGETWVPFTGSLDVFPVTPVELPNGWIATISRQREVVVTKDGGHTFDIVTTSLPFDPMGFVYSEFQQAFVAWYFTCDDLVPEDAILRFSYPLP